MKQTLRLLVSFLALAAPLGGSAAELRVDEAMYQNPEFEYLRPNLGFNPELKVAWVKALKRPESELRRMAADTIAMATEIGVQGLQDTSAELVAVLKDSTSDQVVQRAVGRALVTLDIRESADLLFEHVQTNSLDFAQVVEPALGSWGHEPMLQQWRQRLNDPTTPLGRLLLAIDGLSAAADVDSGAALQKLLAGARNPVRVRLTAATALAQLQHEGLVPLAQKLATAEKSQPINRILAATLLTRHADREAIALLEQLAVDPEPVIAARAMGRLLEIDPQLVFPLAPAAVQSPDPRLRRIGAQALFHQSDVAAVGLLAPLLDDHNPALRRAVAGWLYELAERDLRAEVISQATQTLAGQEWRGLEQACLILGSLDHKPAAERLVELLPHPRDEVMVSSAWALRRLAVPETLPKLLERAELVRNMLLTATYPREINPDGLSGQLSQLMQTFGPMGYREADELLRSMVPKIKRYGGEEMLKPDPRAAAVWSLGFLYEGQAPEQLSQQFVGRMNDQNLLVPEQVNVRRTAALSLGRMQSKQSLAALRAMAANDSVNGFIGQAAYRAIERMTGEEPPARSPAEIQRMNWFLGTLEIR